MWKADIRPHHALDFAKNAVKKKEQRLTQAELSVCHVQSEGWRVKLALSPHPDTCIYVPKVQVSRERYVYQAGPVGPATAFLDEMQKVISVAAEEVPAPAPAPAPEPIPNPIPGPGPDPDPDPDPDSDPDADP